MDSFPVTHLDQPRCATPEALPLVDAAFRNARGPAAQRMRDQLCTGCPAGETCLQIGMSIPTPGVWGGANQHDRVAHGAPFPTPGAIAALRNDSLGLMGPRTSAA